MSAASICSCVRPSATIAHDPMPTVMADSSPLERVFVNPIGNAVRCRRPEVPLEVGVSAEWRGDRREFAAADNGSGLDAGCFDRIFEMFRRLPTHDPYGGTGIGLAARKRIVERHGGTVRGESRPGESPTFSFTLPAL